MKNHKIEDVFKERVRIEKLSQIRELVFGAQDGLLVPLGVISSIAGAFFDPKIVIIAGISEALAGAFSMGTGAYLASQAEAQVHDTEIKKEKESIEKYPEEEKEEMVLILVNEGLNREDANVVVDKLSNSKVVFQNTMIEKELGLTPEPLGVPIKDAMLVGFSYLIAAGIPLFPYFFTQGTMAFVLSILSTLIALFGIGILKAKFALLPYLRSGLQVLFIGAASGFGGYLLGSVLPHLVGIK